MGGTDFEGIGYAVARWRMAAGLTQQQLADLLGVARPYVSMIENGKRPVTKRSLLYSLAEALGVSITDLTGQPYEPRDRQGWELARCVPTLRTALDEDVVLSHARPISQIAADVDLASAARVRCEFGLLEKLLPGLVAETRALANSDSDEAEEATRLAVRVLQTAAATVKTIGHIDLASRLADRAQLAAALSDHPTYKAAADFTAAQMALAAGARRRALRLSTGAAAALGDTGDNLALHWYGMAQLNAALVCAGLGDINASNGHLDEAMLTARRVHGDPWHFEFGATNVDLWRIACALENGEPESAPQLARKINVATIKTPERRARLHIDVGRGFFAANNLDAAVDQFLHADRIAPQDVRSRPQVREIVAHMIRTTGTYRAGSGKLRDLAQRIGVRITPAARKHP